MYPEYAGRHEQSRANRFRPRLPSPLLPLPLLSDSPPQALLPACLISTDVLWDTSSNYSSASSSEGQPLPRFQQRFFASVSQILFLPRQDHIANCLLDIPTQGCVRGTRFSISPSFCLPFLTFYLGTYTNGKVITLFRSPLSHSAFTISSKLVPSFLPHCLYF